MKKTRMIAFAAICVCLILCCSLALAGGGKNAVAKGKMETKGAKVYITSSLYGPTNLKAKVTGTKVKLTWNAESVGTPDGYAIFQTKHLTSAPSSLPYGFYWNGTDGYKWVPNKLLKKTTSTSCTIDLKKKGTYYLIAISYSGSPSSTISSHSAGIVVKITSSASTTASKPTVTTGKANDISESSAKASFTVEKNGGKKVTDAGIQYGYSKDDVHKKSYGSLGTKKGTYTVKISGLKAGKKVYYRAYAKNGSGTAYGSWKTFTTAQSSVSDTKYRALLIGEKTFIRMNQYYELYLDTASRNESDANNMASMLGRVKGPSGAKYQVTKKINQSYSEIRSLIINTFKDTTDSDVSLFFIASHGNSDGDGELEMPYKGKVDDTGYLQEYLKKDSLPFSTLASWLKQYVKGKVIVILESCGAGSAIYSYDEQNGLHSIIGYEEKKGQNGDAAARKIASKAIQAFQAADPGVVEPNSTGDLRSSKFYVLAASRHHEMSWGYEGWYDSQNYFTKWLIDGVGKSGNSPADISPKDSYVTLTELFNYISKTGDHYPFTTSDGKTYYQHVQRYPVGSNYKLFRLN